MGEPGRPHDHQRSQEQLRHGPARDPEPAHRHWIEEGRKLSRRSREDSDRDDAQYRRGRGAGRESVRGRRGFREVDPRLFLGRARGL